MKRYAEVLLAVALGLFLARSASAQPVYSAGDGINGTVHDLTVHGANYPGIPEDPLQRICIYCHAPHNTYKLSPANGGPGVGVGSGTQAPDAFDYLPLWNHDLTPNYALFTMYQNGPGAPTVGAKASQAIQNGMDPGGVSLLCLSCHDGSVAVNAYGNANPGCSVGSSSGGALIESCYVVGKNNYLGNHHPIGFNYDAVQAVDTEIRPADSNDLTPTTTIRDHLYGQGNTQMECATCHSVHNKGNSGERLLWRSDFQSQLCLTCHDKGQYTPPEPAP